MGAYQLSTKNKQQDFVLQSEADAWFERNKKSMLEKSDFTHIDSIVSYVNKDESILEVGSSFGLNLNYIHKKTGAKVSGLEPSQKAITFGKEKYPEIEFTNGIIDSDSPLQFDKKFDHIIIGFCLYLVDHRMLPSVVYQVDRLLKPGGYVHLFDFDSKYPKVSTYGHDKRMNVHKMNFSELFTAFPNYFMAEKRSWSHKAPAFSTDSHERCSTVSLHKEHE